MKFMKLVAKGKKALVPKPFFSREKSEPSANPVRAHSKAVDGAYTHVIPNRSATVVTDKYTAPPKRRPWAYIPEGVCKNC